MNKNARSLNRIAQMSVLNTATKYFHELSEFTQNNHLGLADWHKQGAEKKKAEIAPLEELEKQLLDNLEELYQSSHPRKIDLFSFGRDFYSAASKILDCARKDYGELETAFPQRAKKDFAITYFKVYFEYDDAVPYFFGRSKCPFCGFTQDND